MPVACIIQPGKIGDIIILLPVAKWYVDKGYEVVWPILGTYVNMFKPAVPYVRFLPVGRFSYDLVKQTAGKADLYIDTYFGFSDRKDLTRKWMESGETFDRYKYALANVPFEQKFKLEIVRDSSREMSLYSKMVKSDRYMVIQEKASDCSRLVLEDKDEKNFDQIVRIEGATDSVFDWLTILERASAYKMIDSCFVNLINQMGFQVPGTRYWKPRPQHYRDYPVLNSFWSTCR